MSSNLGQTFDYRYDSRNNQVAMSDASGPAGPSIVRRAFANGALTLNVTNLPGNVTVSFFDGLSRMTRQEVVLTATGQGDGVNVGATLEGVKTSTPTPDTTQGGGDGLIRTGYGWDKNSLQTFLADDQGNFTVYLHDNQNRQVTETKGVVVATTLNKATILGPRDIVTPTVATMNNPAVIAAAKIDAQLAEAQSRISAVASLFPTLADQVHPPTTIMMGYDLDSNVLIREDENDNEVFTKHDAINRAVFVRVFRNGQADSFVGDPDFAPAPVSDPNNLTVNSTIVGTNKQDFQYDGLSRLTEATDNNDPTITADDSEIKNAYDSLSRTIEEQQKIGALPVQAIDSAWRAENLRSKLTYPNGRVLDFRFDKLDRLHTIKEGTTILVDYNYIGAARVLERMLQNGTRETFLNDVGTADVGYDGLRRTIILRHLRSDNSLVVGFTHTYDRMNNKLTEGKLHDPANGENYGYDSAYRLKTFTRNAGGMTPLQSSWNLDGTGNAKQVDGETRQHSTFNEITQRDGTSIQSDDSGNQIDDGTFLFAWDFQNRLHSVTRKSDGLLVAEYDYDASRRRIRKVVTNSGSLNGTTDFYLDGWREIEEHNAADALTKQYVFGNYIDEVLILDRVSLPRLFYHQNSLFSVFVLTDLTAAIREGYQYDAYGQQILYLPGLNGVVDFGGDDVTVRAGVSGVGNPFGHTDLRIDFETTFIFSRLRIFDTVFNVYKSRDPALGVNLYYYANDDPINNVDPTGGQPLTRTPPIGGDSLRGGQPGSRPNFLPPRPPRLSIRFGGVGKDTCGAASWPTQWWLEEPTRVGGIIIQKIDIDLSNVRDCACQKIRNIKEHLGKTEFGQDKLDPDWYPYWEAFPPVPQYFSLTHFNAMSGRAGWGMADDKWDMPSFGDGTQGTVTLRGTAEFYEGLTEDRLKTIGFRYGHPPTRSLLGTQKDPTLKLLDYHFSNIVTRSLTVSWKCCPSGTEGKTTATARRETTMIAGTVYP